MGRASAPRVLVEWSGAGGDDRWRACIEGAPAGPARLLHPSARELDDVDARAVLAARVAHKPLEVELARGALSAVFLEPPAWHLVEDDSAALFLARDGAARSAERVAVVSRVR